MSTERFDSSTLSNEDNAILAEFNTRRAIVGRYLRQHNIQLFTCPSCAFPTLHEKWAFEICIICNWEDDGQDDEEADEISGGPNGKLSLTEYRVATGYMLRALCHDHNGKLVEDPETILAIIKKHGEQMDIFHEENSMNVDEDHPVWEAWKKEKMKLRTDLILHQNHLE